MLHLVASQWQHHVVQWFPTFLSAAAHFASQFSSRGTPKQTTETQGRSQDFSKGGAEVMEAKALKKKNCL